MPAPIPARVQLGQDPVAVGDAHDVEVPDVLALGPRQRTSYAVEVGEQRVVAEGGTHAQLVPLLQPVELGAEVDGLDGVEPGVHADHVVDVAGHRTVVAQPSYLGGDGGVVGGDRARVAGGTQVLARVEAGGGDGGQPSRAAAVEPGALGLGSVLDQRHAGGVADLLEADHRRELAEQVHRDHRLGAVGDRRLDQVGVDEQPVVVAVHEHGCRTDARDRLRGGDERVGGEHDLATGADTRSPQRELERVGAVADADAVVDPGEGGVLTLEVGDRRPVDEGRGGEDGGDACLDLGCDLGVL